MSGIQTWAPPNFFYSPGSYLPLGCALGSSDFPKSLCFMWFLFGHEILRLFIIFFKYWTVSVLFDILSSKNSTAPYKSWKNSLKLSTISKQVLFCADFKKVQLLLRLEVCKDFSHKNDFLLNFLRPYKFFCKHPLFLNTRVLHLF